MCLISEEVIKVSNTKIFCAPNDTKTKQITIYSNFIDNSTLNNAMVLPVPFPESLQFHDLTDYVDIFDQCEKCFHNNVSRSFNSRGATTMNNNVLNVFNVGSYKVSVAQNLNQIVNVDPKVFSLSSGLKKVLEKYYYQPYWGFIICKLSKGNEKYHPFGYSHNIIDNKVYIPTRHFHKEVSQSSNEWEFRMPVSQSNSEWTRNQTNSKISVDNINNSLMFNSEFSNLMSTKPIHTSIKNNLSGSNNMTDDWSHDIYLYNLNPILAPNLLNMSDSSYRWNGKFNISKEKLHFTLDNCLLFEKIKISGSHDNIDIVIPLFA